MPDRENLFEDFPATTKAEWLAKIARDLKGRPFSDLQWHLSESLSIDPFFHPDDHIEVTGPLVRRGAAQNSWEIGEYILLEASLPEANQKALTALKGGAESLLFQCGAHELSDVGLELLLQGIELKMVSLHFEFSVEKGLNSSLSSLRKLSSWRGSAYFTATPSAPLAFTKWPRSEHQQVQMLVVDGRKYYRDVAHTTDELAQMLHFIDPAFRQAAKETSPSLANEQVKLLLSVDTSYFVSIAKIRALKILWANFIHAFGVDPQALPEVEVHLAAYLPEFDTHTNMIRAATQTLSAAIGGADRIFVAPADSSQGLSTEFSRRIARNVQHLLKMESYIDRVIDPAAGSYYIEKLTGILAEEAWEKFCQFFR